jgi:hypothetical protein
MDQRIQLKHPRGKKPVSIRKDKYDLLKPALLKYLRAKGRATHNELMAAVAKQLKSRGTVFEGSVPWHLEWVKLDLEARKIIKRVPDTTPQEYMVVR